MGIIPDLLACQAGGASHGGRQCDWDLLRAGVAISRHGDSSDLAGVDGVGHLRLASISALAGSEAGGEIVLLDGDHRPVDQSRELLHNNLNPRLEDGDVGGDAVDRDGCKTVGAEVGLMEHVAVVIETHQAAGDVEALRGEEVGEVTCASGGVDPFCEGAVGSVAVEVNAGGPAGDDRVAVKAVISDISGVWPHLVLGVAENWASIITDAVVETSVLPGAEDITVVETSDRRRDETARREGGGVAADAGLSKPLLVELNFLQGVGVGGVVEGKMGVGVRDVQELIAVGGVGEPNLERIELDAPGGNLICCGGGGPLVGTSSKRLLELKSCVTWPVIVDWAGRASIPVDGSRCVNVAVAVVADLGIVDGAGVHLGLDAWEPVCDLIHVLGVDSVADVWVCVQLSLEEHVINLGNEVDTTVTSV